MYNNYNYGDWWMYNNYNYGGWWMYNNYMAAGGCTITIWWLVDVQ